MDDLDGFAEAVRADFAFFERGIAGTECIYLDSAATSLKPRPVIDRLTRFYSEVSANVDRGAYLTAEVATREFEGTRSLAAEVMGCEPTEVVITAGCTAAINIVAAGLELRAGQSVLLSLFEHHANLLPWMARHPLVWFDPMTDGVDALDRLLDSNDIGLLAVTACSNVSGAVLPVADYVAVAHAHGVPVLADAAQLAPHFWDELRSLPADFVTLSAHKMLGPFGVGALCARGPWVDRIDPAWLGGGAVEEVTCSSFRLRSGPDRLEPGTPPVAEAVAFAEALRYFQALGPTDVACYESALLAHLLERLRSIEHVRIFDDQWTGLRAPLASFTIQGDLVSAEQLSRMLSDRYGVCARAGHHCAHPYVTARRAPGALRFAASFYNTFDEIDRACDAVDEILTSLL